MFCNNRNHLSSNIVGVFEALTAIVNIDTSICKGDHTLHLSHYQNPRFWCKNANSTMMAADNILVISVFLVASRSQNDGVALNPKFIGFNFIEVSMNL